MSTEQAKSDHTLMRPELNDGSGRVVLLGLGNILLSDEGAGVRAVEAVKERYAFSPALEIVDGGTMGLDLLPLFETADKIIIIDAVDFGREPGHVGVLTGDSIPSVLNTKLSVHHIGLNDVLFAARLMRETMPETCLIGIQPKSLDVGLDMTDEIRLKLDELISLAIRKLKEWNVECALRYPQRSSP